MTKAFFATKQQPGPFLFFQEQRLRFKSNISTDKAVYISELMYHLAIVYVAESIARFLMDV
jgi:hypothetical protein